MQLGARNLGDLLLHRRHLLVQQLGLDLTSYLWQREAKKMVVAPSGRGWRHRWVEGVQARRGYHHQSDPPRQQRIHLVSNLVGGGREGVAQVDQGAGARLRAGTGCMSEWQGKANATENNLTMDVPGAERRSPALQRHSG